MLAEWPQITGFVPFMAKAVGTYIVGMFLYEWLVGYLKSATTGV